MYDYDNVPKRERICSAEKQLKMDIVFELMDIQKNMSCNLRPNRSRETCQSCPNFGFCKFARMERTYIQKHSKAFIDMKVRRKKQDSDRRKIPDFTEKNDVDDFILIAAQMEELGWNWDW